MQLCVLSYRISNAPPSTHCNYAVSSARAERPVARSSALSRVLIPSHLFRPSARVTAYTTRRNSSVILMRVHRAITFYYYFYYCWCASICINVARVLASIAYMDWDVQVTTSSSSVPSILVVRQPTLASFVRVKVRSIGQLMSVCALFCVCVSGHSRNYGFHISTMRV